MQMGWRLRPNRCAISAFLRELEPLLEHATELLGLDPRKAQGLVERVRRFPAPEAPGRERFGEADAYPLSYVDRVEAIDAVYELFSVQRARSLITRTPGDSSGMCCGTQISSATSSMNWGIGRAFPVGRWSSVWGCSARPYRSNRPCRTAPIAMQQQRGY